MIDLYKVNLVLFKIKVLIGEGKCSFEQRREKNIRTLTTLGLLPEDVLQILHDYDTKETYCIWKFGITIDDREIYIKLKLQEDCVKDISFHFAEQKIEYPFKNE